MDSEAINKNWLIGLCAVILIAAAIGVYARFSGGGDESDKSKVNAGNKFPPMSPKKAS